MSEKMRAEFEKWAKENLRCDLSHNGEYYNHTNAYHAWKGWQASRQALVVELSDLPDASYSRNGVVYLSDVEGALGKAGASYK
jgi:hypothetical protein